MKNRDIAPTAIRLAIVVSIGLHLCLLTLLALLSRDNIPPARDAVLAEPVMVAARIMRRERHGPPVRVRASFAARVSTTASTLRPAPRPTIKRSPPTSDPAARIAANRLPTLTAKGRRVFNHVRPTPLPERRLIALAAPPSAVPAAARPIPTPTPSAIPSATDMPIRASFDGLFSQNYPPALPPAAAVLSGLRARLGDHARIRIDVDENGRATEVRFLDSGSDPAAASEVRAELLALHYVPADCNGLHCDGTLEIVL